MSRKMQGLQNVQNLRIAFPQPVPTPGKPLRASKKEVQMCCMLLRFKKHPHLQPQSHDDHLNRPEENFQSSITPWCKPLVRLGFSAQHKLGMNIFLFFWCEKKLGTLDARRQSSRCTRATRAAGGT